MINLLSKPGNIENSAAYSKYLTPWTHFRHSSFKKEIGILLSIIV